MTKSVYGLQQLRQKLRRLPREAHAEIAKAVQKSGQELAQTARLLVPVSNTPGKTPLVETIDYRVTDGGLGFEVSAGGDDKRTIIQAYTVEGGRDGGNPKSRGSMDAQPYMNPAKRLMIKRIKGRMTRAINKAAKRAAGVG